jgi:predicted permease
MLALGIGALTVTFGLADAALLRQPPFPGADRLAMLYITRTGATEGQRRERWSYPRVQLLARTATSFESIANYSPATVTLTGAGDPETLTGEVVSPAYFSLLRVQPLKGRTFLATEDDAAGAHPLAVLSYDLWQRHFNGDSAIIGHSINLNAVPLTVVGVMRPGFRGLSNRAQLWVPTTMAPGLTYGEYLTTNQNFISVIGRLAPGVSIERAQAELSVIGAQIHATIPSAGSSSAETVSATALSLNAARADATTRRSILVLLVAVALLHLLACANVANLLLGRAAARRREAAVRLALGSGRGRLVRVLLAEGVVLAAVGGAAGLLLAGWASSLITVPSGVWGPRGFYGSLAAFDEPAFGFRTVAFGVVLTAVTMLIVSWPPAASLARSDILSGLRSGARGIAFGAGTLRRPTLRGAIVTVEAALAVLLLSAGGLMLVSFAKMRRTELGVDPRHVLTFLLRPSEVRVPPAIAPAFLSRLLDAITHVPGVESATVDGGSPVNGGARGLLHVVGAPQVPAAQLPVVNRHYVAPDHFRTLGIPVLSGRALSANDIATAPKVVVVSSTAARRFWPGENPLGKRIWFGPGSGFGSPDSSAEVVGVVGDVVSEPLDQPPNRSDFYTPYTQFTYAWRYFFVRTAGDPVASVGAIRKAVLSVEPDLPLTEVETLSERIGDSWARHRFDAWLFGGFALVAVVLASAGIYAVVAYAVAQRTREMGIRMALGARPVAIVRLVVREGMAFPAIGLLIGLVAAVAGTRVLRASLYQVTPTDPVILGATVALLLAVSALACLAPARRATRADPTDALRAE